MAIRYFLCSSPKERETYAFSSVLGNSINHLIKKNLVLTNRPIIISYLDNTPSLYSALYSHFFRIENLSLYQSAVINILD